MHLTSKRLRHRDRCALHIICQRDFVSNACQLLTACIVIILFSVPFANAQTPLRTIASAWREPGGRHEFGVSLGASVISGHIWGYADSVRYMPIHLRYSYEFARHKQQWSLRYSPEITALARLSWLQPDATNNVVTSASPRLQTYGSGFSPVGFRWEFRPLSRIQPYISTNAGFIYFADRVLSPQGSQWMYSIDFGAGLNLYRQRTQAVSIGYRYQHLSNANISVHNPGTDANTFYVGFSRFLNKGE